MNYQQLWSTPIGKVQIDLPENIRKTLIQQVIFNYNRRTEAKEPIPSFMDLFDYTQYVGDEKIDVFKAVYRFELIISKIIRSFVEQAWGMNEKAELAMHCTSKVQAPYDMRIEPHRHNNVDLTAVHYLTTGNEFHYRPPDSTLDEGPYLPNDYSGELLLLDPRPCITYPYNDKAKTIKPQNGLTVIHPGYVWHETHQHTQPGVRIALVINVEISKETKVHSSLKQLINMRTLI
jgi:hypothetical protein